MTTEESTIASTESLIEKEPVAATENNLTKVLPVTDTHKIALWNSYLLLLVFANIVCLFFKGYPQDLAYWTDWVKQLAAHGYENFNGNYPPIYIHWLYLIGRFYVLLQLPIEANLLLKFLTQLPVLVAHIAMSRLIFNHLQRMNTETHWLHMTMLLCVLNPAILLNGPIWGQVDLIPVYFACLAILFACSEQKVFLMVPFFILSLLTKFQMIALAPLFGFLFFRRIQQQLVGIVISVFIILLAFLPYIISGHLIQAFKQAYIDTLGQYPLTTFNAANIWILLTGNAAPDTRILFGEHQGILNTLFTAKYFGMLLFSLNSLMLFILGFWKQIKLNRNLNQQEFSAAANQFYLNEHLKYAFFTATLCALSFFALLPAMHERYLFPAVVLSLIYFTIAQQKIVLPILVSLISACNMLIIVELNGSDIWFGLASTLSVLVLVVLLDYLFSDSVSNKIEAWITYWIGRKHFGTNLSVISLSLVFLLFAEHYQIHKLLLNDNQKYLGDLPLIYAKQDHGNFTFNRSYDGNILSVGDKRFEKGFGTHANSNVQFALPDNAKTFSFIVGLDDEVGNADVSFSVWGDNQLLWSSGIYYGNESAKMFTVNIQKVKILTLKVDAQKDDKWDHADWINPVIEFEK